MLHLNIMLQNHVAEGTNACVYFSIFSRISTVSVLVRVDVREWNSCGKGSAGLCVLVSVCVSICVAELLELI